MDGHRREHRRRRLADWDYSSNGMYFITFCTFDREPVLGSIRSWESGCGMRAEFVPSRLGEECIERIREMGKHWPDGMIDAFAVMPNHVHLLVGITELSGKLRADEQLRNQAVPRLVSSIKSAVTHAARQEGIEHSLWQRSFHDHIVRNEAELARIREYIANNPLKWAYDKFYVD